MYRFLAGLTAIFLASALWGADSTLPNIVWLTCEDTGPQLGCYGDAYADTPRLDEFAKSSTRYQIAWSNAPVCAPARTTLITGVYPPSSGGENMRSLVPYPKNMPMYPVLMRDAGYYCVNLVKEDYNVEKNDKVWDTADRNKPWPTLEQHQPFMAVLNFEGTHESRIRSEPHTLVHDPAKAPLPAYHPDLPEIRRDWAQYYDNITTMDKWFGNHLDALKSRGLLENTIVFFYGDHGAGMPRGKRCPYNSGLLVPLLVHIPEKFAHLAAPDMHPGGVSDRMVSFVDFAPTLLSLAGKPAPDWMQGHAFMGRHNTPPQDYLYGFRGRMDERYDLVRTVRNRRYQYIRNYMPFIGYGDYLAYMYLMPTTNAWRKAYLEGKTNDAQSQFWKPHPPEELYDLQQDPDEVVNLVDSPEHREVLNELRGKLKEWIFDIRDVGFLPEGEFFTREPGTPPYELGHNPDRYPLPEIYDMADKASLMKPEDTPALLAGLSSPDSAVRYWAAMGLFARGPEGYSAGANQLRKAAEHDPSPSVRIFAAASLAEFGTEDDLQLALKVLLECANGKQSDYHTAILAFNMIDRLGSRAAPVAEQIQALPNSGSWIRNRQDSYIQRMQDRLKTSLQP